MSGIAGYADFGQKYTFTARPRALRLRYKANVGNITSLGLKQANLLRMMWIPHQYMSA